MIQAAAERVQAEIRSLLRDLPVFSSLNREASFCCLRFVRSVSRQPALSFEFKGLLSDIVVWCFAQRLPQSDLQGHEGAHGHVKENLPDVPQFVQIHVGQADECEGQEGLTVPPD